MGFWGCRFGRRAAIRLSLVAGLLVALPVGVGVRAGGSESVPAAIPKEEPGPSESAYSGLVPLDEGGRAAAELVLVDEADPGRADDDQVVLVSMDGTEHGRGQREGWEPEHPDRGADFHVTGEGVRLTEAPAVDGPVQGCGAVHGAAGMRLAVCGGHGEEIRVIDTYGEQQLLAGPAAGEGEWGYAVPSPNGGWVLAQWSGGCGRGQAYLLESSGDPEPVAALGPGSVAVGWTADSRAVVGSTGEGLCHGAAERGTYLVDPSPHDARKIHALPTMTRLTGFHEWTANRLERVMSRALTERQLVDCCGQPSHGGGDAESGMVFDGHDVQVYAVPQEEFRGKPEGDPLTFACGTDHYFLFDRGPTGSGQESASDWALLERAAQMLAPMLYCTMGGDPQGPLVEEDLLFAYQHRGSVWGVGRSGARHRLTHGPGDSCPVVGPDGATVVFGRLNYDGVYDDLVAVDPRSGAREPLGIAGVAAFSPDGHLAVGEPVDDDLADIEVVVRDGASETARIPLGPQREVGSVTGIAWDTDNRRVLTVLSGSAGHTLWHVDTERRSARTVRLDGIDGTAEWVIGPARTRGVFPAIRKQADQVVWGEVRVSSGAAHFDSWGSLPVAGDGPALDPAAAEYVLPAGRVQVRRHHDGTFTFAPGPEDAWLLGDGNNLVLATRSGRTTHLLSDVAAASFPPTSG